jgi:hypothetical protein
MPEIFLAVVHNGELPDSPSQQSLNVVRDVAQDMQFGVKIREYVEQPELSPAVDRTTLLHLDSQQRSMERRWRVYLGQGSMARDIAAAIGRAVYGVRLHLSNRFAQNAWRAAQIQSFVTKKHLAALRDFASSGADTFVCLESDVVTLDDSEVRFSGFLQDFRGGPTTESTTGVAQYWNLAGGRDFRQLGVVHFRRRTADGFSEFDPAVSNTAAQYACDQPFARQFLAFVDAELEVTDFAIDWVMNAFFISSIAIRCFHAEPPIFGHGSMLGVTTSWNSTR